MSKNTAPKKTKKPRVFRSVDEVKKAYFPKKYAEDMKALNDKIDLLGQRIDAMRHEQVALSQESRSAPAEEWPKAGDWVVALPVDQRAGSLGGALDIGSSPIQVKQIDTTLSGSKRAVLVSTDPRPLHIDCRNFRPATEAEIASHKAKEEQREREAEREKFDVLQPGDTISVATAAERDELLDLFKQAGYRIGVGGYSVATLMLDPDPTWHCDVLSTSSAGKLPFAEGKRRLQGTIAKRAEDERAKEMAKKLEFGTRVEYQGDRGWRIAIDAPHPTAGWLATKSGTTQCAWMKRDRFQILD